METLYARRNLLNGSHFRDWALSQGFQTTLEPSDFHVTIAFSRKKLIWPKPENDLIVFKCKNAGIQHLGNATVLRFDNYVFRKRWREFIDMGATWDYDDYHPHITITYNPNINISKMKPYNGVLTFGPEIFEKLNNNPLINEA